MTSGTLYLCPSDRSARAFHAVLAARDIAPSDCVDVERFCRELWQRGQLFGLIGDPREYVDNTSCNALWQHVVREETDLSACEVARVAALASDAWALAHRYTFPLLSLENLVAGNDNLALFARCALGMQSLLKLRRGITQPELASALMGVLDSLRSLLPSRVVLTPAFAANTALTRLLNAMTQLGVSVEPWVAPQRADVPTLVHRFADATQEMHAAIAWASRALREIDASGNASASAVAIVVPDLSSHRSVWLSALREQFNPVAWWLDPETDRDCFNLSVGLCLGEYPHIHSLITVLRAAYGYNEGNTDTEVLAQALMHPRWGRTPASIKRIEQQLAALLERGMDQSSLADWWDVLSAAVAQCTALNLGHRRNDAAIKEKRASRVTHAATIKDVVLALTERAMIAHSDLFQLDAAWTEAIKGWTQLDRWLPPITAQQAVGEVAQLTNQQPFQPKAGRARIQVMGLLESAGVPIRAAWITGFTDDVVPESFKPNPMLPMAWQAAHNVGLGSRDEVRRRASALWENWGALTGSLCVSYACESEGSVQRISTLAANLVVKNHELAVKPTPSATRSLVSIADEALPLRATPDTAKPLSSSDIERQAHCPRKAAASFMRLREWPEHVVGISPRVRGTLVHEVMAAIGEARMRGILDGAGEPDLAALRAVASNAFTRAVTLAAEKRSRIPATVWDIERARLLPLIDQVLALDAARDGFRVVNVEEDVKTQLFNAAFKLRVDRLDDYAAALAEDEQFAVVLDYKTGAVARADWFAENSSGRLAAPQLPLYLFALHAVMPADLPRIGAMGYIVISDDDVKFIGLGADASLATKTKPGKDEPDWYELTTQWKNQLGQLVGEIETGVADVAPLKGRATCRYCGFASFCREPWSLSGSGAAEPDDAISADGGSAP